MSQAERVIQYIKDFGSITTYDAFVDLGITRLASRIHDIEKSGVRIKRETVKGKNRYGDDTHYTKYSLDIR